MEGREGVAAQWRQTRCLQRPARLKGEEFAVEGLPHHGLPSPALRADNPSSETRGVIPRAVEKIFRAKEALAAQGWRYDLVASFLEVRALGERAEKGETAQRHKGTERRKRDEMANKEGRMRCWKWDSRSRVMERRRGTIKGKERAAGERTRSAWLFC